MNITDEIKKIIDQLNVLDIYNDELPKRREKIDLYLLDLEHYIESNNLNASECCRFVKEFQKYRQLRRQLKKEWTLLKKFNAEKNKLNISTNREILYSDIKRLEKDINQPYNNRIYKKEELEKIIRGKK